MSVVYYVPTRLKWLIFDPGYRPLLAESPLLPSNITKQVNAADRPLLRESQRRHHQNGEFASSRWFRSVPRSTMMQLRFAPSCSQTLTVPGGALTCRGRRYDTPWVTSESDTNPGAEKSVFVCCDAQPSRQLIRAIELDIRMNIDCVLFIVILPSLSLCE